MVAITENINDIVDLISQIPDPEIPVITIKDLGILRGVTFENNEYVVTITPTYTACPAMQMIENQIKEIFASHHITNVKVKLTYTPAWTTDWLSATAKQKLKMYGIAAPHHTTCNNHFNAQSIVTCPRCNSNHTTLISKFGSTACKALYKCNDCYEPFDLFKCH